MMAVFQAAAAAPVAAATAAAPVAAAKAAPAVAEPSAAQKLFSGLGALWRNLSSLEPGELALNLGLSVLVLVSVWLAIWVLRRLLHAGIDKLAQKGVVPESAAAETTTHGQPRIARLSWFLIRACLIVAAFVVLLSIWGLDLLGWLTTTGTGATLSRLLGVVLIAVALIEVAGHVINRILGALAHRVDGGRRNAQMKTLGPLIRGVIQGFIIVVAALTVLSELGVKIGPLLASAGVVGIAVGFGAQTLVKDFLTGLFLVVEDIVAVGDNVRIGDRTGTVEAMTLRTIRVRNMDGTLHILPYSEAQVISNRSKSFSAYIFDLGVAYDTDIDHAYAVIRRVGAEMQADPNWSAKIIQPIEIMGVDKLGDFTMTLKARFRTKPGEQWNVGRDYNKRIKEAFDAEGIVLPFPTRTVLTEVVDRRPAPAPGPDEPTPPAPGDDSTGDPE